MKLFQDRDNYCVIRRSTKHAQEFIFNSRPVRFVFVVIVVVVVAVFVTSEISGIVMVSIKEP